MNILFLNGPNLNLLGSREPDKYGNVTLAEIEKSVREKADKMNVSVKFEQSNHEGELIDFIQNAPGKYDTIVINPGGYTHTSVAIRDAIAAVSTPVIELHISNIFAREEFRRNSLITPVCNGSISGFGTKGYEIALFAAINLK